MKLKKIASLMLAGVMAVSMLAGCQNANVDPEQPTDPETPTATGYSVEMASNLSDAAKKDYIAFEDNADDLAALEDALGKLSWTTTAGYTLPKVATPVIDWVGGADTDLMVNDFVDALDIENINMDDDWVWDALVIDYNRGDAETVKYGLMYVIDGTVDENDALEGIADNVEILLGNLPNVNDYTLTRYTYDYTVSVSVANKPLDVIDWYNGSANFIAVTVTRVPTAA